MAEELASEPERAKRGDATDAVPHNQRAGSNERIGNSIAEMALWHSVASNAAETQSTALKNLDTERIVVDLRLAEATESTVVLLPVEASPRLKTDPIGGTDTDGIIDHRSVPTTPIVDLHRDGVIEAQETKLNHEGLAAASKLQLAAKRLIDVVVAAVALVVLSPILIATAIAIKTTSRGATLYRSVRVGKEGTEFTFLKFRTMYNGASDDREMLENRNEQSGPVFKMRNDPRITKVGRVLRRGSIDELPQLFHVLSGKMSLVGPRPALPCEVAQYDERALQRLTVKAGVTCIWQVSGRSNVGFDTWVEMDLDYIRTWSLREDLSLLVRTIPAVASRRGAY